MVWLIAILCLGVIGVIGYYTGPVRGCFSLIGILFGAVLCNPLSPMTRRMLPTLGLVHPIWQFFVPQALAFLLVLIVFLIVGAFVHRKISLHFKYKASEQKLAAWERMYSRLGLCVGVLNGAFYFFVIMIPIYIGGYFTAEAATTGDNPPAAKFLTHTREELHDLRLDRALAAYDPTPRQVYQASDIADLILHNPLLKSRLAHYPPLLTLGQQDQFKNLGNDMQLLEMIDRQASINEILKSPPIQAIVTDPNTTLEVYNILGNDLNDLQQYLLTGKSAKYDDEPILGVWSIDRQGSLSEERKRHPGMNLRQVGRVRQDLYPLIMDMNLTATTDNKAILKRHQQGQDQPVVSVGSWKKEGATYLVTIPGGKPATSEIQIRDDGTMLLPREGYIMVFNKEM